MKMKVSEANLPLLVGRAAMLVNEPIPSVISWYSKEQLVRIDEWLQMAVEAVSLSGGTRHAPVLEHFKEKLLEKKLGIEQLPKSE